MGLINIPDRRIRKPIGMPQIDWDDPLNRGLVGYWGMFPYEFGGKVVHDLSGNRNHGTLVDDITWTTGKYGSALFVNGAAGSEDHYINIPDSPSLRLPNAFTIIINVFAVGFTQDLNVLVSKYPANYLFHIDSFRRMSFSYKIGGAVKTLLDADVSDKIDTDTWYQLAVTRTSAGVLKFYQNAIETATHTEAGTIDTDGTDLLIGNQNPTANRSWEGLIDTPLIYNRDLSVSEIALLLRRPF